MNTLISRSPYIYCLILVVSLLVSSCESNNDNGLPTALSVDAEAYPSNEIFRVVEVMPRFPGCEDTDLSDNDKKACSDKKLLEYLYSNLSYPEEARKKGIQGRVYVQFVVEKDGSISDINLAKGIGGGCDEAAIAVLDKMNQDEITWQPGLQKGTPVRVLYTLPVSYLLEG